MHFTATAEYFTGTRYVHEVIAIKKRAGKIFVRRGTETDFVEATMYYNDPHLMFEFPDCRPTLRIFDHLNPPKPIREMFLDLGGKL